MSHRIASALLVLVFTQLATASEDPPPSNANRPVRLLTIGNSFSRNATRFSPTWLKPAVIP